MSSENSPRSDVTATVELELRARTSDANRMEQIAAKLYGVNRTDLQALEVISRTGGISPSELARSVGLTTGGMTTVIDRLERAGYAYRSRDGRDRRKVVVQPTALTRDREQKIFAPIVKALREIAGSYDDQELAVIRDFIRRTGEAQRAHGDALTSMLPAEPG